MALVKEYFELTKKYQEEYGENTILLMQVGAFFEVYGIYEKETETVKGSKIIEFSQICELNVVDKHASIEKDTIMMAGFKDLQIEKYIKKIQHVGFTTVVYVQDEATKNTSRSLAGIFSPGTYFQTESPNLTNNITCIWVNLVDNKILMKGKFVVVGVANIDIYTGKASIFQFKETYINNPTTYDELERFISIYNPCEVILISDLLEEKEMDYIISYAGINCNLIHKNYINTHTDYDTNQDTEKIKRIKNCEKQPYQKEVLSKFYTFDDFHVFSQNFYEYNIATQSFCYLLDFVYQHNPHLVNKISEPNFENCSTRLLLANHTLKQLNIINDGNVKANKYSCVSHMLNNCQTPMGKRKFLYNVLNPVCDEIYLQREYTMMDSYLSKFDMFHSILKMKIGSVKDLSKFERQIVLKKISPKSFYILYNNIQTIKEIFDMVSHEEDLMKYCGFFEKHILHVGEYCSHILEFINQHIHLHLAKDIDEYKHFEVNFIKTGVDQELDKKTEILKDSESKLEIIRQYFNELIETKEKKSKNIKNSDYVKIHETEKNNICLVSTSRRCKLIQESLPKENTLVALSFSNSSNTLKSFDFHVSKTHFAFEKMSSSSSNNSIEDKQIHEICKNISTIKISMKDMITLVYNKFVESLENYQTHMETINHFITLVDVLHTKCSLAKKYNYCKPIIVESEKSCVHAKQLRHCLIEQFQTNELYVSNDLILGDGNTDGVLLYGTNAVGKTSFIKALGVSIIMAQAGMYVPCSEFHYKPYKYIFTRIIGNDNIFKGLSTFAVEMSELRTILRLMDKNSLILGDELCSGTETMSAISIFVSGIQQLYKCKSSFIFATHLHEIVDFEEITKLETVVMKHMSVVYDKENQTLVYDRKLKDGPGSNMYGLEVCKSLNLPQEFLDAAYEIRTKYCPETGSLLSLKSSHYNSKKIIGMCEKCGKHPGKEVHHLQHQSSANDNGIIVTSDSPFHKNTLANLMTLCEICHDETHKSSKKGSKRIKTTKGTQIQDI
jgi:DNA mismatch repair protein MutS